MDLIRKPEGKKKTSLSDEELEKRLLNWPESYYKESEPEIRRQILEKATEKEMTAEDNEIRRKFFDRRYPNFGKRDLPGLDLYLRTWMDFRFAAENSSAFAVKKRKKELLKSLSNMGYFDAETEQEKRILYQEIRQLGLLYIRYCLKDRGYNSVILGFGQLSDDKLTKKIGNEFVDVAVRAPSRVGIKEECKIWSEALIDAFSEAFPDYAEEFFS